MNRAGETRQVSNRLAGFMPMAGGTAWGGHAEPPPPEKQQGESLLLYAVTMQARAELTHIKPSACPYMAAHELDLH